MKELYSLDAEQAVLGAAMLDNSRVDELSGLINAEDFYFPEHQKIWRSIVELMQKNTPVDLLTMTDRLQSERLKESDENIVYLSQLYQNTPSAANSQAYAKIVYEKSITRRLSGICHDMMRRCFDMRDACAGDLIEEAERQIFLLARKDKASSEIQSLSSVLMCTLEDMRKTWESGGGLRGISTGFQELDQMTSGLQGGNLIIIGARPSMGKTCLAMNIAEHVAINEKKSVLFFSLEMPASQLGFRLISSQSRVNQQVLTKGDFKDAENLRISNAIAVLKDSPLHIDDSGTLTPYQLRSKARRFMKQNGPLSLIVIDYIQLMDSGKKTENKTIEIGEISRALKAIAKEFNCTVIALSQLNREVEKRQTKRPTMSDLRDSGSIEQDADVVILIHREEVDGQERMPIGPAEIIVSKNRNGPTGVERLVFCGPFSRFEVSDEYNFRS